MPTFRYYMYIGSCMYIEIYVNLFVCANTSMFLVIVYLVSKCYTTINNADKNIRYLASRLGEKFIWFYQKHYLQ